MDDLNLSKVSLDARFKYPSYYRRIFTKNNNVTAKENIKIYKSS